MIVEVLPIMGDNFAYLVACTETGQAAAVDPADAGAVTRRTGELGLELVSIWNTHHHLDHAGGNEELARGKSLSIYGHELDSGRIPGLTHVLEHETEFMLGRLSVKVLHTPGHTTGSVCYLVDGDALFTGDTLFGGGCGRLFEGDAATLFHSLHEVLAVLPAQTRLYFGHEYTEKNLAFALTVEPGNIRLQKRQQATRAIRSRGEHTTPSTLAVEMATNPFLRCASEEVIGIIKERFPTEDLIPLKVFTRLREMRNDW